MRKLGILLLAYSLNACNSGPNIPAYLTSYSEQCLDVPYMASDAQGYEHLKSYPGYVEILKKYKLPHPKEP